MKIGVLALQGDFDAHRKRLEELGAEVVLVKKTEQLDEIDGLVIPGGESGTFLNLLGEAGFEKLKQFVRVKPTFEGSDPVAVRQGRVMASTFHPELSDDTRVHRAFLDLVRNGH